MAEYKAAVIGLGRMGSTFDDEMTRGGSLFLPYCHAPAYHYSPQTRLVAGADTHDCLLYTSPSPRDATLSRMPSSA